MVWQIKMADLTVAAMVPVGAEFTLVALVSGSAWGKPRWGTWWICDARLTSELMPQFLYAGFIALWLAFDASCRDSGVSGSGEPADYSLLASETS